MADVSNTLRQMQEKQDKQIHSSKKTFTDLEAVNVELDEMRTRIDSAQCMDVEATLMSEILMLRSEMCEMQEILNKEGVDFLETRIVDSADHKTVVEEQKTNHTKLANELRVLQEDMDADVEALQANLYGGLQQIREELTSRQETGGKKPCKE